MQFLLSNLRFAVRRYAVALWSLSLATLVSLTFVHFYGWHRSVVFSYLFAVLITAWWGGYGPGILACVTGAFLAPYLLVPNYTIAQMDWPRLVLIILISILTSRVAASSADTQAALRRLNDELDERVRLRTRELELANAALKESETRLGLALDSGHMGVWEWNIRACRVTWSPQLEAIHGLAPGDFRGTFDDFQHAIHPDDVEGVLAQINAALAGEADYHTEYRVQRPDGSVIWVETRGQLIRDSLGQPERIVGVCMEITARRRAEQALREQADQLTRSNADLQQFAYVASHDLQEPLRMVASYAQLLTRRYQGKLDADADTVVGYMIEGVTRMEALIRDLLNYSRVIHGASQTDAPVTLTEAFQSALVNLDSAIRDSGAVITCDHLPSVAGDQNQMTQVFQNLIGNALKYRRAEPPRVVVSSVFEDNHWRIVVSDNGIGIPAQYQQSIFAPFKRLHTRDYPGNGIGLAICQRVIERQGGRIWVQSSSHCGTEFAFTLPAIAQRAANGGSH